MVGEENAPGGGATAIAQGNARAVVQAQSLLIGRVSKAPAFFRDSSPVKRLSTTTESVDG